MAEACAAADDCPDFSALVNRLQDARGYPLSNEELQVLSQLTIVGTADGAARYAALRNFLQQLCIHTSEHGSNYDVLSRFLVMHYAGSLPEHLYTITNIRLRRRAEYDACLSGLTLEGLASNLLTPSQRTDYLDKGWIQFNLNLTSIEARMLNAANKLRLVELGVDTADPATFKNAEFRAGMDYGFGWLRVPTAGLQSQYLNSHPSFYATMVGIYAAELIRLGSPSSLDAVRACLELRSQVYNSKMHLPQKTGEFVRHLDCDFTNSNTHIPAPQTFVALSPNHVDGDEIYRVRFINLNTDEHKRRIRETEVCGAHSYEIPRKSTSRSYGAKDCPGYVEQRFRADDAEPSPDQISFGDFIIFHHLVAHEFTQRPVRPENVGKYLSIRLAEYPFLMSPLLHGVLHQTVSEVIRATVDGEVPECWPHLYTGNKLDFKAAAHLEALFEHLPCPPFTQLGRCIAGLDEWNAFPSSLAWLCRAAKGACTLANALKVPVAEHRAVCEDKLSQIQDRIQSLGRPDSSRMRVLRLRLAEGRSWTSSSVHPTYADDVCRAAQGVKADSSLWSVTPQEARECDADAKFLSQYMDGLKRRHESLLVHAQALVQACLSHAFLCPHASAVSEGQGHPSVPDGSSPSVPDSSHLVSTPARRAGTSLPSRGNKQRRMNATEASSGVALPVPRAVADRTADMVFPTSSPGTVNCGSVDYVLTGLADREQTSFCVVAEPSEQVVKRVRDHFNAYAGRFGVATAAPITKTAWHNTCMLGGEASSPSSRVPPDKFLLRDGLFIVGYPLWFCPAQVNAVRILLALTAASCVIQSSPLSCARLVVQLHNASYRHIALLDTTGMANLRKIAAALTRTDLTALARTGREQGVCKKVIQKLQERQLMKVPAEQADAVAYQLEVFLHGQCGMPEDVSLVCSSAAATTLPLVSGETSLLAMHQGLVSTPHDLGTEDVLAMYDEYGV